MRFLVDAQLPPALARLLTEHGHVAEHVNDTDRGSASDREVCRYANDVGATIITKDEDFANMVTIGGDVPVVVWVRVGNTRRAPLLAWFEPLIEAIVAMAEGGDRLIELR